jgi:hypothetical protein
MEKVVADQNDLLTRIVNVLEIKFDKQGNKTARAPPVEDIMYFLDSMKHWRKDFSLKEMLAIG